MVADRSAQRVVENGEHTYRPAAALPFRHPSMEVMMRVKNGAHFHRIQRISAKRKIAKRFNM
jgi:hypothetical protein